MIVSIVLCVKTKKCLKDIYNDDEKNEKKVLLF
jgi:hypothetical protein